MPYCHALKYEFDLALTAISTNLGPSISHFQNSQILPPPITPPALSPHPSAVFSPRFVASAVGRILSPPRSIPRLVPPANRRHRCRPSAPAASAVADPQLRRYCIMPSSSGRSSATPWLSPAPRGPSQFRAMTTSARRLLSSRARLLRRRPFSTLPPSPKMLTSPSSSAVSRRACSTCG